MNKITLTTTLNNKKNKIAPRTSNTDPRMPAEHVLGTVSLPKESYAELLQGFREFAREQGKTVVGVQLQSHDAESYVKQGFTVNQVGASHAIDLSKFSLQGTKFMRLRNKNARAHKAGLVVREANRAPRELETLLIAAAG